MKNGPGDCAWGLRMLFQDMRNNYQPQPEQPMPQPQQPIQQPPQQVQPSAPQQISNIVNYPPMAVPTQLKRFGFASVLLTVSMLIIASVLLWKTGALDYIIEACRSMIN